MGELPVFGLLLAGDWKINFELYAKALNLTEKEKEVIVEYDNKVEEVKTNLKIK
ncbi:hypothetical protein [Lysinibacillus sp. SGAir0095]|uniref:hypothetical protein n=1 Tax=Lysinibacillus sp. SGAir0095 TaxID=2070463 RepID=UPI00197B38FD|nr:hypothetical protein [Lysinibacillus sp. SGAir0095]